MANASILAMKEQHVAEIKDRLTRAQSVVMFDYRGLTVDEVTALRVEMRKAGVEYIVLKNTMVERACRELNIDESVHAMLKGPSAFAFGYDDAVAPAKILKDSIKKFKKCTIKGGIVDGVVTDAQGIDALADLPPREVLIARMLGSMMSPITGLAIALDQLAKKLGGNSFLCFLQAEAEFCADNLDNVEFLCAEALEDNVKFGLLFNGFCCCCGACNCNCGCCCGYAEFFRAFLPFEY